MRASPVVTRARSWHTERRGEPSMHRKRYAQLAAVAILIGTVAGCGGGDGGDDNAGEKMVWCAAPGETVDAEFKREYPELYMTKSECDRWKDAQK